MNYAFKSRHSPSLQKMESIGCKIAWFTLYLRCICGNIIPKLLIKRVSGYAERHAQSGVHVSPFAPFYA